MIKFYIQIEPVKKRLNPARSWMKRSKDEIKILLFSLFGKSRNDDIFPEEKNIYRNRWFITYNCFQQSFNQFILNKETMQDNKRKRSAKIKGKRYSHNQMLFVFPSGMVWAYSNLLIISEKESMELGENMKRWEDIKRRAGGLII